jgi:hypothetical protein
MAVAGVWVLADASALGVGVTVVGKEVGASDDGASWGIEPMMVVAG